MYHALAIGFALFLAWILWRFFVTPLGRKMHERELEMLRRKLERLEARREEADAGAGDEG